MLKKRHTLAPPNIADIYFHISTHGRIFSTLLSHWNVKLSKNQCASVSSELQPTETFAE